MASASCITRRSYSTLPTAKVERFDIRIGVSCTQSSHQSETFVLYFLLVVCV